MANKKPKQNSSNYVDINSNTQVIKVHNRKGFALRIVAVVLSVIMIMLGSVMIWGNSFIAGMYENISEDEIKIEQINDDDDKPQNTNINNVVTDGELLNDPKVLNVMLFGEDYNHGSGYGRSDSMIMMTINNRSKSIKLTSFQRDTYVYIPGVGYNKINAAYSAGGPALSIRTVEANFGINIDRYAKVDFKSFQKIVDILGGVEIYITAEEAGYINWQMYINNQAPDRNTLAEVDGKVTLTGKQALWYARNRGFQEEGYSEVYAGDDWDRTDRQRKFINAVMEEMKTASLTEIFEIVTAVGPLIKTNFSTEEITSLLPNALTYLNYEFESYSMPQDGYWQYGNNEAGSVILITDMDSARADLAKFVFDGVEGIDDGEDENSSDSEA